MIFFKCQNWSTKVHDLISAVCISEGKNEKNIETPKNACLLRRNFNCLSGIYLKKAYRIHESNFCVFVKAGKQKSMKHKRGYDPSLPCSPIWFPTVPHRDTRGTYGKVRIFHIISPHSPYSFPYPYGLLLIPFSITMSSFPPVLLFCLLSCGAVEAAASTLLAISHAVLLSPFGGYSNPSI